MSFLNGTFLGYSAMYGQSELPSISSYNKITYYGQCRADKIHIQNIALSEAQIQAINPTTQVTWGTNTVLLATFENHTLDGNILYLPDVLTGWKIYRRDVTTNISKLIAEVGAETSQYIDYTVAENRKYVYELIPYTSTQLGSPLITDEVNTNVLFGWYLLDYDNPSAYSIYKFDLNLVSGSIDNEVEVVTYDTYAQKPVYAIGKRDYIKGQISCIAGTINADGTLYQPYDYLDNLRSFINNGRVKMLKSRKGHVWKVITFGMPMQHMDDIGDQPVTVSFNFSEVE